ncbi:MAG: hypothetical protein OJF62_002845 [Pseudolabrys sp.]|nr:hypothetical protein [Pseudolabrys sp.]
MSREDTCRAQTPGGEELSHRAWPGPLSGLEHRLASRRCRISFPASTSNFATMAHDPVGIWVRRLTPLISGLSSWIGLPSPFILKREDWGTIRKVDCDCGGFDTFRAGKAGLLSCSGDGTIARLGDCITSKTS